jgi:transcriptional regulator with XRE-family HTH domain
MDQDLRMQTARVGRGLRVVRRRLGLRQADLAARAGVSQQTISRVERGLLAQVTLGTLEGVADALSVTLEIGMRWRGPEIEKMADARHARLLDAVRARLPAEWQVVVEYTFNEFGDRGSVDILGWRPSARALLLVEVKSELDGLESVLRPIDLKRRVVPRLVERERGWRAASIGTILVLPDESTARRAVRSVGALLDVALPSRGREARTWLVAPTGDLRAVWFLSNTHGASVVRNAGSQGRIMKPRRAQPGGPPSVAMAAAERGIGPAGRRAALAEACAAFADAAVQSKTHHMSK